MKVAVTGGRNFDDGGYLFAVLDSLHAMRPIVTIIHGGQRGADSLAKEWATIREVPEIRTFNARWYGDGGKKAGPMRNRRMLMWSQPDLLVAFPGASGTDNCVKIARELGIEVLDRRTK